MTLLFRFKLTSITDTPRMENSEPDIDSDTDQNIKLELDDVNVCVTSVHNFLKQKTNSLPTS